MQDELMFLWLLLPVAFLIGWYIGNSSKIKSKVSKNISLEYFKGLNFVLNEQPDKAIEVFIKMVEVDNDTVDTHLALGNLFRRRGEVDRAIRIHQNLIARTTLSETERAHALLELGMDYMRSGLLDRAEKLFLELLDIGFYLKEAHFNLLEIYQQEKDWENAIVIAKKYETISKLSLSSTIAQFFCELADDELRKGQVKKAKEKIQNAIDSNSKCARASILQAKIYQLSGETKLAIKCYKRLESQDSDYITEIISPLFDCYMILGDINSFIDYLKKLSNSHKNTNIIIALAELIAEYKGEDIAANFIFEKLENKPSVLGIDKLIEYVLNKSEGSTHDYLKIIKKLMSKLIEKKPTYKCNNCGFDAKILHWQCPGCKHWESIRPIFGVISE